jgi:hypothetical protein
MKQLNEIRRMQQLAAIRKGKYLDNPSQTLNLSLDLSNYNRNQLENLADSLADLGQRKQENQVRLYIKDNF